MGQEMDGERPVGNESCFTFTKAFSFSPDHRDSLEKMLEIYWENKNYKPGTSDFLIRKHIITSLLGPLWKIHEVVLERTGLLCQTETVNTQLQNWNGLGFSKGLLTPNSLFMKENVYHPKSGISKGLATGKSFFTISSKLFSKALCLKIRAFTEKKKI